MKNKLFYYIAGIFIVLVIIGNLIHHIPALTALICYFVGIAVCREANNFNKHEEIKK